MSAAQRPVPLTDLRRRAPIARRCIHATLTRLLGEVELRYEFYREWNGCWRVRVDVAERGQLDFTLLDTPGGGLLALPRPLPERWRAAGVVASDGTVWTVDETGELTLVSG